MTAEVVVQLDVWQQVRQYHCRVPMRYPSIVNRTIWYPGSPPWTSGSPPKSPAVPILAGLRDQTFLDLAALNTATRVLLDEFNDRPMKKLGVSHRALYEQIDAATVTADAEIKITPGEISALAGCDLPPARPSSIMSRATIASWCSARSGCVTTGASTGW